jgi:hypothetical protein
MTPKPNVEAPPRKAPAPPATPSPASMMAVIAPAVGWLVPGMGHLMQKRWIRGLLLMISVCAMFFLGVAMQGKVYSANPSDILEALGLVGDIGNGGLYIVTKALGYGQGAIFRATADYGTKYVIVAGLLNIICVVDAYHIAVGKKK